MSELAHYGVKGMKWGVRKAEPDNPGYSRNQRAYDQREHGSGGVKRINKRLNKGQDLKKARRNEVKFKRRRNRAIGIAASLAVKAATNPNGLRGTFAILGMFGEVAAQHIAKKAETNRGRAAAANLMGLPSRPSSINYARPNRRGVYNISSL